MIRSLKKTRKRRMRLGKTTKRKKMPLLRFSQLCQQTWMPSVILPLISCISSLPSLLQPSAYFMFTSRQLPQGKVLKKIKGHLMKKGKLISLIFLLARVLILLKCLKTIMKRKNLAWKISRKEFLTVKMMLRLIIMQVFINIEILELFIVYDSICI